jgi:hypothetical protein
MAVQPNPFLDPNDGHVLADDMEKRRETFWRPVPIQQNPFLLGTNPKTGQSPYGMPLPACRPGCLAG